MLNSSHQYRIRGTKVIMPYLAQPTPGETRLIFSLERLFSPDQILADCYFATAHSFSSRQNLTSSSQLAQIDCLAINEQGIYVFESKDYSGWIYGHGERLNWTQVLNFGREKHQFFNPIRQNHTHLKAIQEIFDYPYPIFSIIVFSRNAELKVITDLPENCLVCTQANLRQKLPELKSPRTLSSATQTVILNQIRASLINPTTLTRAEHIDEVNLASSQNPAHADAHSQ